MPLRKPCAAAADFKRMKTGSGIARHIDGRFFSRSRRHTFGREPNPPIAAICCKFVNSSIRLGRCVLAIVRVCSLVKSATATLQQQPISATIPQISMLREYVYTRSMARSTKWQHKQSNRRSNARRQIRSNTGGARNMPNDDPMYQYNYKIQHRRCNQQTMSRSNQHIFWSKPSA